MKRIPLSATRGTPRAFALVDDEDYPRVGEFAWTLSEGSTKAGALSYAYRKVDKKTVYLHRVISGRERGDGTKVDHLDGDGLNNQRSNLRVTTHAINMRNRRPRSFGTSRYRGVYWNKGAQKWFARATVDYRVIWLGSFDDEDDAGRVVEAFWAAEAAKAAA